MSEQTAWDRTTRDRDAEWAGDTPGTDQWTSINGAVVVLALLTCLFIVALPMLGSLALAGAVLGLFSGAGLATLFVLSRV